ncbi:hypothetical protein SNEBB_003269 [Seison nebaliae]|nr:hypothetical protein SNEBB_003269 [Seison nebaliae]
MGKCLSKKKPTTGKIDKEWDRVDDEKILQVFKFFDRDNSGKIDQSELKNAYREIGCNFSDEEIESMIQMADIDGNNKIDLQEFKRIYMETMVS